MSAQPAAAPPERPIAFAAAPAAPPPLALYLHLPWCGRKCPYCDFNSHNVPTTLPDLQYTDALIADMESALPQVWGRRLSAVFIGGGTPSLFSPAAIARLLDAARALFNPPPDTEITLEANPDSSDAGKFAEFRAAGINRLSLGVQSFNDDHLRALGRLHNAAAAHAAAAAARRVFDNINLDLMYALPQQTAAQALADVNAAILHAPDHLSLYQLTLEPGTPFYRRPPPRLPDQDAAADIADAVRHRAQAANYRQYEISAYARPNRQCRHNLNYWQFGDYLGIGAGAHGKITHPPDAPAAPPRITRTQRIKHPADYMRRLQQGDSPIAQQRDLNQQDLACEFMLNALRLTDGFPADWLATRAGGATQRMQRLLQQASDAALLHQSPTRIRPTQKGLRYLDDLTAMFLPTT